jgi:hypothetical protein
MTTVVRPNAARRQTFINELADLVAGGRFAEAIGRVAADGLGLGPHNTRWVNAVQWFADRRAEQAADDRISDQWIARQGLYVLDGASR